MSADKVVADIRALFEAQLAAEVIARYPDAVADFAYTEWETPSDSATPTSAPNIQIMATAWIAPVRGPDPTRLSHVPIEIVFRFFASPQDTAIIAAEVNAVALAMARLLDTLHEFSRDSGSGTVQMIETDYTFRIGVLPNEGSAMATANGFTLAFSVLERDTL